MARSSAEISATLRKARRRGRPLLWVLALLIFGVLGGWFWFEGAASRNPVRFFTDEVRRGNLEVDVTATGTVQPTTKVTVSSELSGTIASVGVDFNDRVHVGQVLARLDDTKLRTQLTNAEASFAAAEAQLSQAEVTAAEAKSNYERQLRLDARGVTTHTDLVAYEAANGRASAAVRIAEANLKLAEANLELARADLADTEIKSPIDGIVLDRQAEVGQTVAASLSAPELFTLAEDLRRMELQVDIDEADIGRVREGNSATFTVDAYPNRRFDAKVAQLRFAPEETNGVVTYKGVLTVDNADLLLRPGMTATANITVAHVENGLIVPNAALRYVPPQTATDDTGSRSSGLLGLILPSRPPDGGGVARADGTTVWILRDGAPVEIPVQTGESDGRSTEVVSGELADGDSVIIDQTGAE